MNAPVNKPNNTKFSTHAEKLVEIIRYLRISPKGCPWTKEQTHKSLAPYFVEESYEAIEAIDNNDIGENLKSELGDVMLQIALHAQIADEGKRFNFDDVAKSICDKLIRRYPTILGDEDGDLKTAEDVDKKWEEVKAQERKAKGIDPSNASIFDDVPHAVPALIRAEKVNKRIIRSGGDHWFNKTALLDKLDEELDEVKQEANRPEFNKQAMADEIGDLLLVTTKLAQFYDINAEDSLRRASKRIENRWRFVESKLKDKCSNFKLASIEEVAQHWKEAKISEKK